MTDCDRRRRNDKVKEIRREQRDRPNRTVLEVIGEEAIDVGANRQEGDAESAPGRQNQFSYPLSFCSLSEPCAEEQCDRR
jgi:hypothetical protein